MTESATTPYQFTIGAAIAEWLAQKETRTGSKKTRQAYEDTMYTFVQEVCKLEIPDPIESVKKRTVQAYASAVPIDPETVEQGLEHVDRGTLQSPSDYAILAVALSTGR